jgi:hypothetical protein
VVIENLLIWCETNAASEASKVVAVGLAYVHGLNEHQIAAATAATSGNQTTIEFPLARRAAEIVYAERASLVLNEPGWLATAAAVLTRSQTTFEDEARLYRGRSRLNLPTSAGHVRKLVAAAGHSSSGVRVSCASLNRSRVVALRRAGLPFALYGIGYAISWAARLAAAESVVLMPRSTT